MNFTNFSNLYWEKSFSLFRLKGIGSQKFLHGQTTSDILDLNQNQIVKTCWLSPIGRIKALLEIRLIDTDMEFIFLGGDIKETIESLNKVIFPSDNVVIEQAGFIRRIQEISSHQSWLQSDFKWLSIEEKIPYPPEAYNLANSSQIEQWRIQQGLPYALSELSGEYNPFELGLSSLINLNKGCYLGQETMAKIRNSSQLKQKLRCWHINEKISSNENLKGSHLLAEDGNLAGIITSYERISQNIIIGLALIRRKYLSSEELLINKTKVKVNIEIPTGFIDMLELS